MIQSCPLTGMFVLAIPTVHPLGQRILPHLDFRCNRNRFLLYWFRISLLPQFFSVADTGVKRKAAGYAAGALS